MWRKYVGGYNDEFDGLYHNIEYRILGETELCYIVEDVYGEEVAIEKYKFEIWD